MLQESEIQKYGGKAAILNHIKEKLPTIPIPNYVVKEYGKDISSILPDFNKMKKPVIIRSSSPFEYGDFEGIFDSVKDVYDERGLVEAIKQVEESATSERAKIYAFQNEFKIDSRIHTIIQEQNQGINGVIMRHPNNPDLIYINLRTTKKKRYSNESEFYLFNQKTNSFEEKRNSYSISFDEDQIRKIIDDYVQIENLKEIAEGWNLFGEFGMAPFSLFQIRPFKKIETADFELEDKLIYETKKLNVLSENCFGITPKEGIVLPVLKGIGINEIITILPKDKTLGMQYLKNEDSTLAMDLFNLIMYYEHLTRKDFLKDTTQILYQHYEKLNERVREPYCFITSSIKNDDWDIDLSVPNTKGLIFGNGKDFLTHNSLRLLKKADISMISDNLIMREFYKNISSKEKVRIISNGKEAIAIKD